MEWLEFLSLIWFSLFAMAVPDEVFSCCCDFGWQMTMPTPTTPCSNCPGGTLVESWSISVSGTVDDQCGIDPTGFDGTFIVEPIDGLSDCFRAENPGEKIEVATLGCPDPPHEQCRNYRLSIDGSGNMGVFVGGKNKSEPCDFEFPIDTEYAEYTLSAASVDCSGGLHTLDKVSDLGFYTFPATITVESV